MERQGLFSRKPQANEWDMPWTRCHNSACQLQRSGPCSEQLHGTSAEVLIRVLNKPWNVGLGIRRWPEDKCGRGTIVSTCEDQMCSSIALAGWLGWEGRMAAQGGVALSQANGEDGECLRLQCLPSDSSWG